MLLSRLVDSHEIVGWGGHLAVALHEVGTDVHGKRATHVDRELSFAAPDVHQQVAFLPIIAHKKWCIYVVGLLRSSRARK